MDLSTLAKKLADRARFGMTPALADKLGVKSEDATRGQLMAMIEGDRGPLGVYLLAVYVVDDTDWIGDGEIYWWSVPALVDLAGNARWSALYGLPAGAPPFSCGSGAWMGNMPLKDPALLAVIPSDDDIASVAIRLGVYDDDAKPPEFAASMLAGYEALASCKREGLQGSSQVTTPVRDAIYTKLEASEDDRMIDEELVVARGESGLFGVGFIGSVMKAKARAYYMVRDERRTEVIGPITVLKGETSRLSFPFALKRGGRISVFARAASLDCGVFGVLSTDKPFAGKVVDDGLAKTLAIGLDVTATGSAEVVAFYTPP